MYGQWEAAQETFREEYPDYDVVARNPTLPVSQAMADVLMELDNGPEVLYHLGKNPELAAKLAGLNDRKASIELARVSERLTTQVKRESSAPKPIEPVKSTGAANADPLSDKLSAEQWLKNRQKQVHERRASR